MIDDVPLKVKKRRLQEIIDTFYSTASILKQNKYVGSHQLVLVEGVSRKSSNDFVGRADSNIRIVFPCDRIPSDDPSDRTFSAPSVGEFVKVEVFYSIVFSIPTAYNIHFIKGR